MGRSKEISLKKYLRNGAYLTVPKWLVPATGLDTAVFLCALIEIANTRLKGQDANEHTMPVHAKKIHKIYGISDHRQNIIMRTLHQCRIMRITGERNQYRNKIVSLQLQYCETVFAMLKELENDEQRSNFFIRLQTSREQRDAVRERRQQDILERERMIFIAVRRDTCSEHCSAFRDYASQRQYACGDCLEYSKHTPNCTDCRKLEELFNQLKQSCEIKCPDFDRDCEEAA